MQFAGAVVSNPGEPREFRSNQSGGRLGITSATNLRLSVYNGEIVEVAGDLVNISTPKDCPTSGNVLGGSGEDSGVGPSASTNYGVFLCSPRHAAFPGELRLGPTTFVTSALSGQRYLAASGEGALCRCLGMVRLSSLSQFLDQLDKRLVLNFENQVPLPLFVCPAYVDNNAQTTFSLNSATWAQINAGTSDFVEVLTDGYNAVDLTLNLCVSSTPAAVTNWGIGVDSTTAATVARILPASAANTGVSVRLTRVLTNTNHVLRALGVSGGASTIIADLVRNGSVADPAATFLSGWTMQ